MTDSMKKAIDETKRRREIQIKHNLDNNITPQTIIKQVKEPLHIAEDVKGFDKYLNEEQKLNTRSKQQLIASLEKQMKEAAKNLDFEAAAELRDILLELKTED